MPCEKCKVTIQEVYDELYKIRDMVYDSIEKGLLEDECHHFVDDMEPHLSRLLLVRDCKEEDK